MSIVDIWAVQRIADAVRGGDLDRLPGAGRPLDRAEEPFVSGEQRMLDTILEIAGYAPPERALRREIAHLHAESAQPADGERHRELRRRLAALLLRMSESRCRH